jgi:hypothetical protein
MWQQIGNLTRPLRRQAREHLLQISIRIMSILRADGIRLIVAAARLLLRINPANNQFERPSAHGRLVLNLVVVDVHSSIVQVAR